jgi:hypothetical protein
MMGMQLFALVLIIASATSIITTFFVTENLPAPPTLAPTSIPTLQPTLVPSHSPTVLLFGKAYVLSTTVDPDIAGWATTLSPDGTKTCEMNLVTTPKRTRIRSYNHGWNVTFEVNQTGLVDGVCTFSGDSNQMVTSMRHGPTSIYIRRCTLHSIWSCTNTQDFNLGVSVTDGSSWFRPRCGLTCDAMFLPVLNNIFLFYWNGTGYAMNSTSTIQSVDADVEDSLIVYPSGTRLVTVAMNYGNSTGVVYDMQQLADKTWNRSVIYRVDGVTGLRVGGTPGNIFIAPAEAEGTFKHYVWSNYTWNLAGTYTTPATCQIFEPPSISLSPYMVMVMCELQPYAYIYHQVNATGLELFQTMVVPSSFIGNDHNGISSNGRRVMLSVYNTDEDDYDQLIYDLIDSSAPSKTPTTSTPSRTPTKSPSRAPTSSKPSRTPSTAPSKAPTSSKPSSTPSTTPTTSKPSTTPTKSPSRAPTTSKPSRSPSKAPSRSPSTPPPICFHSSSMVQLESGVEVRLDELNYQDKVLAMAPNPRTGVLDLPIYSSVVGFTGVFPNRTGVAVNIDYGEREPLFVSPVHLLYAKLHSEDEAPDFYQAYELTMDSLLYVHFEPKKILRITQNQQTGWYTPLTEHGTIVVNGVLASCHTGSIPHRVVRTFYQPLHWYLGMFPRKGIPTESDHEDWFSIGIRRSTVGQAMMGVLAYSF